MAVQGNAETVTTVLTIDTSKSASSMKELRDQIKALKDQLVGLDQGTQEYENTIVELGEKMHQMKEVNEEIRRTNSDFGDTLGNISKVMAGGVAAVQGMTAGLSLLGVEMGDDNKLTQNLVKSMALLQSLGSMEKAIKSMKALIVVMKASITTAGGLGAALKALALSNPFTAILAAGAAVAALFVSLKNKAKEEAKQIEEAFKQMKENVESFISDLETRRDYYSLQAKHRDFMKKNEKAAEEMLAEYRQKYGDNEVEMTAALIKELETRIDKYIRFNDTRAEADTRYMLGYITKSRQTMMSGLQVIENEEQRIKQLAKDHEKDLKDWEDKRRKAAIDAANARKEKEKAAYNLALKRLNLQKRLDDTELTTRYEQEKRDAQGNAQQLLAIEEKYQYERYVLNKRYYENAIKLAEDYKKKVKDAADLVALNQTIADLNASLQEGADAWANYQKENAAANIELKRSKIDAEGTIKSLDQQTAAMEREIEITRAHNERYLELVKQKWVLQSDLTAEAIRYQQEQLQNANIGIDEDLTALKTRHEAEMALLEEQYDAKLIAEEEYLQKKKELEAQYNNESTALLQARFENEAALDELAVEAKKNEVERKKELEEVYMSAISSITGSITAVLNEAANAEDISFEDQKKLKIASTIITTLTSAMEAYQSVASIPVVGPALGAAAAASTIAVGMMQVNKIRQTKKNSSNASASVGAVQAVQTPTQMTNITGFSDNVELPDQRVYVVYDDIQQAGNHVQVVENNSSF